MPQLGVGGTERWGGGNDPAQQGTMGNLQSAGLFDPCVGVRGQGCVGVRLRRRVGSSV